MHPRPSLHRAACAVCAGALSAGFAATAATAAPVPGQVAWAAQVCSSLNHWQNTFDRRITGLTTSPPTRPALLDAISGLTREAVVLRAVFQRGSAPHVPQGAAIQQSLRLTAAGLVAALSKDRTQALTLPAPGVVAAIGRQGKAIGATFVGLGARYHSTELNEALDQVAQCELIHG